MSDEVIKYGKIKIIITTICLSVLLLVKCMNKINDKTTPANRHAFEEFTGSQTCMNCHKEIYGSHLTTAHYLSSAIASLESIKGSFEMGSNTFQFSNGSLVSMEKRGDSLFQVEYINGRERRNHVIDIVIGSGAKGQSFLYWGGNKLYQHPMTYFTAANQWSNSPGYPNKVMFQKPVTARCLECHVTYAYKVSDTSRIQEEFDRNKILYGIDCEKCHGPAAQHVAFHTANDSVAGAKFITNPAKFTRQQSLDLCALCHGGGLLKKSGPSFGFTPGDAISNYFVWDTINNRTAYLDVHGNQFGLMLQSKCFTQSTTLTCGSCHDSHKNERDNLTVFSQRCMNCHTTGHNNFCKEKSLPADILKTNCIDCHMPDLPSRSIVVQLQNEPVPVASLLRTHHIKVYPDKARAFGDLMKKSSQKKVNRN
jgi:nitrate/TMAO reductase-like tetraheme cytochrome c subunit